MSALGGTLQPVLNNVLLGVTDLPGSASGPSISFSAGTFTEGVDDNPVTMSVSNATDAENWDITVSSSGGGTPVTSSGVVSASSFTSNLNLTSLNPGILTAIYEEGSVEMDRGSATLQGAGAGQAIGLLLTLTKAA